MDQETPVGKKKRNTRGAPVNKILLLPAGHNQAMI